MKSLGLLVLRLVTGVIFIAHGLPKLIGGEGKGDKLSEQQKQVLGEHFVGAMEQGGIANTIGMLENLGVPNPKPMAWALALTETLGGLFVVLGIKTRPAAIGLATVQTVAIGKVHRNQGLVGGYEFNLLLLASAICIAIAGPGKIAKD